MMHDGMYHQSGPAAWSRQRRSPEEFVEAMKDAESSDCLQQGLVNMPFEQRSTLILAYQTGCTLEEIAAITSAPVWIVKARMLRARENLRGFLPGSNAGVSEPTSTDEWV
jgi:DNA-directed RNA polymerase specialized sigma24 family protein